MTAAALLQLIAARVNDNTNGEITPSRLREVLNEIVGSMGIIDDTKIQASTAYSSFKIENLITAKTNSVINDSTASVSTTYSSNKIDTLINNVAANAGVKIDDTTASDTTTFSGNKISALVDATLKINDTAASTTATYSSLKVDTLISAAMANAGAKIDDVTATDSTVYSSLKVSDLIAAIPPAPEYTASNGLTKTGNDIKLGGIVNDNVLLEGGTLSLIEFGSNAKPVWGHMVRAGAGGITMYTTAYVGIEAPAVSISIGDTYATYTDKRTTKKGLEYGGDYSAGFTLRSIVDKGYVDTAISNANVVVNDASTTVKGIVKLSVAPVTASEPIAVGTNDTRLSDARIPLAHVHSATDINAGTLNNARLNTTVVMQHQTLIVLI